TVGRSVPDLLETTSIPDTLLINVVKLCLDLGVIIFEKVWNPQPIAYITSECSFEFFEKLRRGYF
ncbi:MAG: hypothetical protein ACE5K8_07010, partial [Candidatus Zixiibacteriota bacterium]